MLNPIPEHNVFLKPNSNCDILENILFNEANSYFYLILTMDKNQLLKEPNALKLYYFYSRMPLIMGFLWKALNFLG